MKSLQLSNDLELIDLSLRYKDCLVLGDIQIGYEESLNKQGILIPRRDIEETIQRIDRILAQTNIKTIVFNGDLKHEFGTISRQEWKDVTALLEHLKKKGYKLIVIKGNHDVILGPIVEKLNIKLVDYYHIDNITILHGDKILPNLSDIIIIGHEHPAISFPERRDEKYKCFLVGTWHEKKLVVLPSFNTLTIGTDISKEETLSPFLNQDLSAFKVYVVEEEHGDSRILSFGSLKQMRKL